MLDAENWMPTKYGYGINGYVQVYVLPLLVQKQQSQIYTLIPTMATSTGRR